MAGSPPNAAALWSIYPQHAAIVMSGGSAPSTYATARSCLITSGSHHVDMNQAILFGGATQADAEDLCERVLAAEVPVLLGCSEGVAVHAAPALAEAGFVPLPKPEALYWMPAAPAALDAPPFDVRRVESDGDVGAMQALFEEAHGYEPVLTRTMFGRWLGTDDAASTWIAWDGAEPVSLAIVTSAERSLSLWNVLTPPRHRRRGAGRTVVAAALTAVAARAEDAGEPIEQTFFWSSPAGRPLYEAMGFVVADNVDAWVLGASEADLAAFGA